LTEQIGDGGFGLVFLAEQQPVRRKVALKIIKREKKRVGSLFQRSAKTPGPFFSRPSSDWGYGELKRCVRELRVVFERCRHREVQDKDLDFWWKSFRSRKRHFVANPRCNEIAIGAQGVTARDRFVHIVHESLLSFTPVCRNHERNET
jgi:serine/threonine protein kinase